MGDENYCIHLDPKREMYMMMVLNLKTARDKCLPPVVDPHETGFKVGGMVLLKK